MSVPAKRQRSTSDDADDSVDDDNIRAGLQDSFIRMSTNETIAQMLVEKRVLTRKTKLLAANFEIKRAEMEEEMSELAMKHEEMVDTLKDSELAIESAAKHLYDITKATATEEREHSKLKERIRQATDMKIRIDSEISDGSGHWQQWKRNTNKQESDAGYWYGEVNAARGEYVKLENEVSYSRVGVG